MALETDAGLTRRCWTSSAAVRTLESVVDRQTVAIYDFENGAAQYLHTNARGIPRVSD